MIEIDYQKCTGCGACVQTCLISCIEWETKELGFQYPIVNKEKCINCGNCVNVCPINISSRVSSHRRAYAVVNRNKEVLYNSTSGGMFSALAHYTLKNNGVVYGCSMEPGFIVRHIRVDNEQDLDKLRGSKYVQSDTSDTFIKVIDDLNNGKLVLYTGTPCQIAGLKAVIKKQYDNLITADVICHGVGSQLYFNRFLDALEKREGKLLSLRFRSKKYVGWSCGGELLSENGKNRPFYNSNNYYYHYFLNGDIYRQSCYICRYANIDREGDFTLGDFWGIEKLKTDLNTYDGCSLVIVNNKKALNVFSQLGDIEFCEVNLETAIMFNEQLSKPSQYKESRLLRQNEYERLTGPEIEELYFKANKKVLIKGLIKRMIPYSVRRRIRNFTH